MEYFIGLLNNKVHLKYVCLAYFISFFLISGLVLLSKIRTKRFEKEHKDLKIKMKAKHKRSIFILFIMTFVSIGAYILLTNLRDNLVFFYSPSEILTKIPKADQKIRVGGMVDSNSLERRIIEDSGKKYEEISFTISDNETLLEIKYFGILPDLFREGQGVVAEGFFDLEDRVFNATNVLAKHDENYMPPEIEKTLDRKGIEK